MAWVQDPHKKKRKTTRSGSDLGDMAAFKGKIDFVGTQVVAH
jgi:hypothetical protein